MKLLRITSLVSVGTVVVLGAIAWFIPESAHRHTSAAPVYDASKDPDPGMNLDALRFPRADARGVEIPATIGRDMVIHGGACTGCSLSAVSYSKLPIAAFDRIFVFYQSVESEITEQIAGSTVPDNVFLIADEAGQVKDMLNAQWTGRWYAYENGLLERMQSEPYDDSWGE